MAYTQKLVSGNVQRRDGGVVAFATSTSGPITTVLNTSHLNTKSLGVNEPIGSGAAGYFGHGNTYILGSEANFATYNPDYIIRQMWPWYGERKPFRGIRNPIAVHTRTTRKIRTVTGYDYVTGAAEGVSVDNTNFGRDDAVTSTEQGEFVFIPAGGKLPSQNGGDQLYYTYSRLY